MLTVKKIKEILVHDKLYFNSKLKPEKVKYESEIHKLNNSNSIVQLYPKKLSDHELILKFKEECIFASKHYTKLCKNLKIIYKPVCNSLKEAKKDLGSSELSFETLVEFDGRKFAFAAPEYVGVICEDINGLMDLKIFNPNAVVEIKEKTC